MKGNRCGCQPWNYREWRAVIRFGDTIPKKGDRRIVDVKLEAGGTAEVEIEIWSITHQEWYHENGVVTGLLIEFTCWIEEMRNIQRRPKLTLVK